MWNDSTLPISDCRLNWLTLSLICLLNVAAGPFKSERWLSSLKQMAEEYVICADTSNPFWTNLQQQIMDEASVDIDERFALDPEDVFQTLPQVVQSKNAKVGMSSWFEVIVSLAKLTPMRSRRLLLSLQLCMVSNIFPKGKAAEPLKLPTYEQPVMKMPLGPAQLKIVQTYNGFGHDSRTP